MVFLRNECSCFHVRGAAVLGTDSLSLGLDAISLWCSTERTLSGRFVSPAARFVSKRHSPFVNYFLHYLFQGFTPFRH